jgi:nucleoid-associated protein YgaU
VRRGDTLTAIAAEKYGDASLWRAIAEQNQIVDPLALRPGQVLIIPAIE